MFFISSFFGDMSSSESESGTDKGEPLLGSCSGVLRTGDSLSDADMFRNDNPGRPRIGASSIVVSLARVGISDTVKYGGGKAWRRFVQRSNGLISVHAQQTVQHMYRAHRPLPIHHLPNLDRMTLLELVPSMSLKRRFDGAAGGDEAGAVARPLSCEAEGISTPACRLNRAGFGTTLTTILDVDLIPSRVVPDPDVLLRDDARVQ